ncbi:MAG: AsmA-like C-terminal domain-containing protein [Planctomycetia bacterium]|nr:AsmA-like C-terminal domain-containing protein [Planctomycetia bacterium]
MKKYFSGLFNWSLFFGLLALIIVSIILYRRGNTELHQYVRKIVNEKFPQVQVDIGRIQLIEMQGLRLHSVRFIDPKKHQDLLTIEEIYLECPISIRKFLNNTIKPTRAVLRYPVWYVSDQSPLLDQLKSLAPKKDKDQVLIPFTVQDGSVLFRNESRKRSAIEPFSCSGIQMKIDPPESEEKTASWTFSGKISNAFLRKFDFRGSVRKDLSDWNCSGSLTDLELNEDILAFFPISENFSEKLKSFRGRTTFQFTVNRSAVSPLGYALNLNGELFRGSISLSLLKYPVSDLYIRYSITDNQLKADRITGRSGPVTILANYQQEGLLRSKSSRLKIQLDEFSLDNVLLNEYSAFLSPKLRSLLDEYDFSAVAKINLDVINTEGKWKPNRIAVVCRQLEGYWKKFPYRQEQLRGQILLSENGNLQFHFANDPETQSIRIDGLFTNITEKPLGRVEISGNGIALDSKLFKAIPPSFRKTLLELNPKGMIDARLLITKGPNGIDPEYSINVRDTSIRYEKFPFPVSNIAGTILYKNNHWSFMNLEGRGRSTLVKASGVFAPDPRSADEKILKLQLQFDGFPLGEELENALVSFPQRDLIEKLHLHGKVNAQARILYETAARKFDLEFEGRPIPGVSSIKPEIFPYELRNLDGLFVYRQGEIVIENLRGRNGQSKYQAGIRCIFGQNGSWKIDVNSFTADQLLFDHELQSAVPMAVLSFMDEMKLRGYFNLSGALQFSKISPKDPLEAAWDIGLILQQNTAAFKTPIKNICGKMQLRGIYRDNQSIQMHGELDLDSLCIKDIQTIQLTGPFYYDGKKISFGETVPPPQELSLYLNDFLRQKLLQDSSLKSGPVSFSPQSQIRGQVPAQPLGRKENEITDHRNAAPVNFPAKKENRPSNRRPLKGSIFQGTALLNGDLVFEDHLSYRIGIALQKANLKEAMRDLAKSENTLSGNVSLFANFAGESSNIATLKGNGNIIVSEAALYELPFFMKIFQGLSIKKDERGAFNSSQIAFRAFGNKMCLDNVLLEGNALSLFGSGWLTLEENENYIDLKMNSRLGNSQSQIPVISDVIGGAGDQIAQIRVEGRLSDPTIWAERFPGLKKAWWSIFPNQEPEPSAEISEPQPVRPVVNGIKKVVNNEENPL